MLAYKIQKSGNYPEESKQHSEHGKSLKSRKLKLNLYCIYDPGNDLIMVKIYSPFCT